MSRVNLGCICLECAVSFLSSFWSEGLKEITSRAPSFPQKYNPPEIPMRLHPVATKLNAPAYENLVGFMESLGKFLILKVWK